MKRTIFSIVVIFIVINAFSQSARKNISFSHIPWKVYADNEFVDYSQIYSKSVDIEGDLLPGQIIVGQLLIDKLSSMATLYHYGSSISIEFQFNGDKVNNELDNDDFFADVSPFLIAGVNYIILKVNEPISKINFFEALSTTQLSLLEGLIFTKFEVKKDTYFGGNLIEAKVHNFNDRDLDGKIIGKLFLPETMELIAENSNCAYTRSGQDLTVDIIFPDLKLDLKGRKILVELTLVDKENNEELVDMLTLPTIF